MGNSFTLTDDQISRSLDLASELFQKKYLVYYGFSRVDYEITGVDVVDVFGEEQQQFPPCSREFKSTADLTIRGLLELFLTSCQKGHKKIFQQELKTTGLPEVVKYIVSMFANLFPYFDTDAGASVRGSFFARFGFLFPLFRDKKLGLNNHSPYTGEDGEKNWNKALRVFKDSLGELKLAFEGLFGTRGFRNVLAEFLKAEEQEDLEFEKKAAEIAIYYMPEPFGFEQPGTVGRR